MDGSPEDTCILDWDETRVHQWLSSLGFSQYEHQIREHKITGDVLCMLDPEGLKALGVSSVGQRLCILKHVYTLKLAQDVPLDPEHYVPPSATNERIPQRITLNELHGIVTDQGARLRVLEKENKKLKDALRSLWGIYHHLQTRHAEPDDISLIERPIPFPGVPNAKLPANTPIRISSETHHRPSQLEDDGSHSLHMRSSSESSGDLPFPTQPQIPPKHPVNLENLKRFKVGVDDPTWKVLPVALARYKINSEQWSNYGMFLCYGSAGDRRERCLTHDEKPLLLFQNLRDARKNPVCVLKLTKKPTRSWTRPMKPPFRSPMMARSENTKG